MVNFNFGLGAGNAQDDPVATSTDPATTQDAGKSDDTALPTVAEPAAPSTEAAKPLTELMTEETQPSTEAETPAPVIKENAPEESPTKITPEVITPTEDIKIEEQVTLETTAAPEAPANPFAAPAAEKNKTEEVAPAEEEKTETPAVANPFASPAAPVKENKKIKETPVVEERVQAEMPAPANPFAAPATEEKNTEEVKPAKEKKSEAPTPAPANPFAAPAAKEEKKEEAVKPTEEPKVEEAAPMFGGSGNDDSATQTGDAKDPMKSVAHVKDDIVAFVDFHKKNIRNHQQDITESEKKIQEEKKLLKEKGDAYAKLLKELQDLTQNFGGLNGNGGNHKPQQNRPQHKPRPDNRK